MKKGLLYLVGTPIGNMEDITIRALKTLREVDLIAAEDTRRTVKLLNRYRIKTPLTSYHEHNKKDKGMKLLQKLEYGIELALVSDAGMPGISDPGEELVRMALEKGIRVTVLPGACALVTGIVLSGLSTEAFTYTGFLPRAGKDRIKQLERLKAGNETLVFYEAPHRLLDTLRNIYEIMGDRRVAVARELTKVHEDVVRGCLGQVLNRLKDVEPRGEYVVVVEGRPIAETIREAREYWREMTIEEHYGMYLEKGYERMDAMKMVAADRGVSKRDVYAQIKKA